MYVNTEAREGERAVHPLSPYVDMPLSLWLLNVNVNHAFGKRSLKYKGSHMWNSLPESLKSIQSTSLFKHRLRAFLLTAV